MRSRGPRTDTVPEQPGTVISTPTRQPQMKLHQALTRHGLDPGTVVHAIGGDQVDLLIQPVQLPISVPFSTVDHEPPALQVSSRMLGNNLSTADAPQVRE